MYNVEVGISDIDPYDMIFYGNYIKYNLRACFEFFKKSLLDLEVDEILIMKYIKPINWTSNPKISTELIEISKQNGFYQYKVFQEWFVNKNVCNRSIIIYKSKIQVNQDDIEEFCKDLKEVIQTKPIEY